MKKTITLETVVGREKDVQVVDVSAGCSKIVVALQAMRVFNIYQAHQEVMHTFVVQLQFLG